MNRRGLAIAGLCGLVLGAGALLYGVVFDDDEAAPPAPIAESAPVKPRPPVEAPTKAPAGETFEIVEITGTVEIRRGDVWQAARVGDRVVATEAIRTGKGSSAVLRTEAGDQLALREKVELEVGVLDRTVTELTLTRGKVKARAAPGSERFQITSGRTRAIGRRGGRFTVYADPRGAVNVASEEGEVRVVAGGKEVSVAEGKQTRVPAGGSPEDPVAVPDQVLLTVGWPPGQVHARRATVRGRAARGAIVRVNGEEVAVKEDGTYEAEVPLKHGPNRVEVEAEGVDGKTAVKTGRIVADTRGPPIETDPSNMFDPPGKKKPKR